ncbi:MAG: CHAT domain-containing protein [Gammaproteobacteria bacterium]|nr:CHAT domain-containing protein [Gammaproteobacteria bacterium]MCP5196863.1 CHAT domain-containing protein [Gammaproteobacteria bacterium]
MTYPESRLWRPLLPGALVSLLLCLSVATLATPSEPEAGIEPAMTAGAAAAQRGQFDQAAQHWQAASIAAAQAGDTARQLDALLQLADAQQALGYARDMLATLHTAQALAEQLDDPVRRAAALGALGKAEWSVGAAEEARRHLESSITLARQAQASHIAAASLNHLGNLRIDQGDRSAARSAYQDSLELARQTGDKALIATVLLNAARLAQQEGDARRAETLLTEAARAIQALPDGHDKAFQQLTLGQRRRDQPGADAARRKQAAQDFAAAATLARQLGDARSLSYALGYRAQLHQETGQSGAALAQYRQAVFAAQEIDAPELLYRWQWAIGRLLHAQGDEDGAILAYQQAVANLQRMRPDFIATRRAVAGQSFRVRVGDAFVELADLLLRRAARPSDSTRRAADLLAARDTMEALKTAEVKDYFQDDCVVALQSRTVALDRSPPHTAILYPILLPDRLVLLLKIGQGIQQTSVPVAHETLTHTVREFRHYLEKRTTREYLPLAQQLYGWLIEPLRTELTTQDIDTLVIIPDGPLRTIPLAALHDGQRFLIDRYAVATTPGLTLTDLRPVRRQAIQPLLNGLTESVQGFPPLEHVQQELTAIHAVYGGTVLEDQDFRLASVQQELQQTPYSIVHIASHGQFASEARDTFLLTFDDKLTLDRLERFMSLSQYRDQPVELLTLSACQTAAGDDRAALGLAGVAVKAGARSALATLWFVNDQASAQLVTEFYQQLRNPDLSKAQALQQAQLTLVNDRRYRHPGYWSPFLLIGNWL